MQFPGPLPKELKEYASAASEEALFSLLIAKPQALLLFFETACFDETWSENHPRFMSKLIDWLTKQAFDDKLAHEFSARAAAAMRRHHSVLQAFIPKNITIKFKNGSSEINSLLLGTISDYFKEVLLRHCRDQKQMWFALSQISKEEFYPFEGYARTGVVPDLWRMGPKEIFSLLNQASIWGVIAVIEACESMLRKYLTNEDVVETLILAQARSWRLLKKECIEFINQQQRGFNLAISSHDGLAIEFQNFKEDTLQHFMPFSRIITHVICHGAFVDSPAFSKVMQACPSLMILDLSSTPCFSEFFKEIPKSLRTLNLSQCTWLSGALLKQWPLICPELQELLLGSNVHLNLNAWGELLKFTKLTKLNLAGCIQLKDDELKIILKACANLLSLDLAGCDRINDTGFFELARNLPRLNTLNLARSRVSDAAIAEIGARCQRLLTLGLARCELLTEKGVLALVKQAHALQELDLSHCAFAFGIMERLQRLHPSLKIIV